MDYIRKKDGHMTNLLFSTKWLTMINNLSPSYLPVLVSQSINNISHYNLRNANDRSAICCLKNKLCIITFCNQGSGTT